ncbi:MAG: glycosyltransferase family 39 protein [Candidatus Aureabacteria bacterium]|nr:glycosyltransferase family 39 protein [Candidatus Auribacterota bacterium]
MNEPAHPFKYLSSLFYFIFFLYAGIFIYQTSFRIGDTRFFCLFDDAMISMRYAKNLADGFGLVWNPGGEKIEGFSNPLWVGLMSFFHLFPIGSSKICLVIQISGLIFYVLSLVLITKTAEILSGGSKAVSIGAFFLTAFYYPLHNWMLQGTETGLQTFVVCFSVWLLLCHRETKRLKWWVYLMLGTGTLIRLDMVVPYLCVSLLLIYQEKQNKIRHGIIAVSIFAFFLGIQTLFRQLYYHEWLPNTYYLKMTGLFFPYRITRGGYVFFQFVRQINPLLFFLPAGLLFVKNDRPVVLHLIVFSTQILYSIWVGGDAWERGDANRFLAFVMPLYFSVYAYALSYFLSRLGEHAAIFKAKQNFIYGILIFFSLIQFNSFSLDGWHEFLFQKKPYEVSENQLNTEKALLVKAVTKENATIGASRVGAMAYFSCRYTIDFLGKNDKKIAGLPAKNPPPGVSPWTSFFPGHNKWDYAWSIGELQPDIVVHLWQYWSGPQEAKPYLLNDYRLIQWPNSRYNVYVRNHSARILWDNEMIQCGLINR